MRWILIIAMVLSVRGAMGWYACADDARGYGETATDRAAGKNYDTAGRPAEAAGPRFVSVELMLDAGATPVAAYQLEFRATGGATITGIEGGASTAFAEPPYYDPAAMRNERAILAAFSTAGPDALPTGKTRLATIHLMIEGDAAPQYETRLVLAADAQGKKIPASLALTTESAE